jgi:vesicle transport through interaction with t-SNAREs protein 1
MDSAPGLELFESYESDYSQLASSIKNKLDVEVKEKKGESKKTLLRAVQRELEEADEIVSLIV